MLDLDFYLENYIYIYIYMQITEGGQKNVMASTTEKDGIITFY
jgi:hypothetical protein